MTKQFSLSLANSGTQPSGIDRLMAQFMAAAMPLVPEASRYILGLFSQTSASECCENVLKETDFTYSIESDATLEVYAGISRIEQVVTNFVTNAMKYAPDSKDIKIQIERFPGMVKVSVIDKGAGIPAKNLPSLFDRYYRVDHSGDTYTGLGLGLYLCSEIIKKHNGTIGVDSEIGIGSTFWFTLPTS